MPLHTFHAFVVVEYDFDVLASSADEAEEMARTNWLQNRSIVNVAHVEVELADHTDSNDLVDWTSAQPAAPDAADPTETAETDDSLDTPTTDE